MATIRELRRVVDGLRLAVTEYDEVVLSEALDALDEAQAHVATLQERVIALGGALAESRAQIARDAPVLAAVEAWAGARRHETEMIAASAVHNHRGRAWFARCVAGEDVCAALAALVAALDERNVAPW